MVSSGAAHEALLLDKRRKVSAILFQMRHNSSAFKFRSSHLKGSHSTTGSAFIALLISRTYITSREHGHFVMRSSSSSTIFSSPLTSCRAASTPLGLGTALLAGLCSVGSGLLWPDDLGRSLLRFL